MVDNLPFRVLTYGSKLDYGSSGQHVIESFVDTGNPKRTLLATQRSAVHGLAKNLNSHRASLLEVAFFLVVLLQQALSRCVVGAHRRCLPSTVVSGGVRLVELELALLIVACVDERDTERTKTWCC